MNERIIEDKKFGSANEISQQPLIESIVGKVRKSDREYDVYDYHNRYCFIELKSRNIAHNAYATTMIGAGKLAFIKKHPEKEYYWFFKYTTGLYYHKYDPTYKYEIKFAGRNDRGKPEYKDHVFLPIELLTKVVTPALSDED